MKTAYQKLSMLVVAGIIVMLAGAMTLMVRFDEPGLTGAGVGAVLGLVNLAIGTLLARRALRRGMQSAMATLLGGFFTRLVVLVVLTFVFHRTDSVDEVAFVLAFMIFFFVYVGLEIRLVGRTLGQKRSPA